MYEMRQLLFSITRIVDKEHDDPFLQVYKEMLEFKDEPNWANDILGLRRTYNLPLNDDKCSKDVS